MYRYLKIDDQVIAFRDHAVIDLAKYAIAFPQAVRPIVDGFSIYNARQNRKHFLVHKLDNDYMLDLSVSKDATSLYRVCLALRGK